MSCSEGRTPYTSRPRDIDNRELYEPHAVVRLPSGLYRTAQPTRTDGLTPPCTSIMNQTTARPSHHRPSAPANTASTSMAATIVTGDRKGKSVSRPIPIQGRATSAAPSMDEAELLFSLSPLPSPSEAAGSRMVDGANMSLDALDLFSMSVGHDDVLMFARRRNALDLSTSPDDGVAAASTSISSKGKGKVSDLPVLPPLSFTPMEVGYGRLAWPSPGSPSLIPGPTSYGSGFASPPTSPSAPYSPASRSVFVSGSPSSAQHLLRVRTLSESPVRSTRSLTDRIRVKLGSPTSPKTLARRLFSRKREGRGLVAGIGQETSNITSQTGSPISSPTTPASPDILSGPSSHTVFDLEVGPTVLNVEPLQTEMVKPNRDALLLKSKTRSYSSPYPLTASVLEVVPPSTADLFVPLIVEPICWFELLPREIKIHIFLTLVRLHEAEHERAVRNGSWTALKAASPRHRWVGQLKALREIVRMGRVCKPWLELSRDGQLWSKMDLRTFTKLQASALLPLARIAGPFVQQLNLAGHTTFDPEDLISLADSFCLRMDRCTFVSQSQLQEVNLRGCSSLTTRALHYFLMCCPDLRYLNLHGLSAVTNTSCDIIAVYCPELISVDLSRCMNLDGGGFRSYLNAAVDREDRLPLKELRLSGLRYLPSDTLSILAQVAPDLEVLDLSYVRGLHNSTIRAFVQCDKFDDVQSKIELTSREAGFDPADPKTHWRRLTRLRQLNLSSCQSLTDMACKFLAHSVPDLEILELAGIGAQLHDEGLVQLLRTTPRIRKLDLEDANNISDAVLVALTPYISNSGHARSVLQPGMSLEHLCVSYAVNLTDDAVQSLVAACPQLRVLEADNTRMSGQVLKDFVRTVRRRQIADAVIAAGDNRNVSEPIVRDVAEHSRPRLGWRGWDARRLAFLDARDNESLLDVGQDECDSSRVVVKTFYSWQTVDAVRAARKKRAKARRVPSYDSDYDSGTIDRGEGSGRRWWASGRRMTPTILDAREGDACVIM